MNREDISRLILEPNFSSSLFQSPPIPPSTHQLPQFPTKHSHIHTIIILLKKAYLKQQVQKQKHDSENPILSTHLKNTTIRAVETFLHNTERRQKTKKPVREARR